MSDLFSFGERLDDYPVPVLNERAVRAGAGILFLFAMVAFMNAWLLGNFQPTRVFVVAFLIDFALRIFVNPRYAPSLVLGQWLVRKQQPEWTGAPQKRFAWAIGFGLAALMLWLVVIRQVVGPLNLLVCATCLTLLFFEAALGICLGCKVYNLFNQTAAQLCPGNACDAAPDARLRLRGAQGLVLALYLGVVLGVVQTVYSGAAPTASAPLAPPTTPETSGQTSASSEAERCKVPDFAKAMGHEELWKLHNHCK